MSNFLSQPPSDQPASLGNFFRGGMMPATPTKTGSLVIFDFRSLKLSIEDAKEIEGVLRETLFAELEKRELTKGRSAMELSGSIFGIAID